MLMGLSVKIAHIEQHGAMNQAICDCESNGCQSYFTRQYCGMLNVWLMSLLKTYY